MGREICCCYPQFGDYAVKFTETSLCGAYILDIEPIEDERGFFARSWCIDEFKQHGLNSQLAQCNISFNHKKGTLRGMHYQIKPHEETKIVRCTHGALYDVIIDIRSQSPTYKKWFGIELTQENHRAIYIPEGFAHGFQTLEDNTEVLYMMSALYHAESARGISWDDPNIAIQWPLVITAISKRDLSYPAFSL